MLRLETTNTFQEGMIMDLNPIATPNNVLTNALNATLITYNGNENVLQNDMGNGRVETAYLPKGYIPLGTCELGGIIYIAAFNPLTNKSLIGSFPSPERNITSDEVNSGAKTLNCSSFYEENTKEAAVITDTVKLILYDKELHAGDKFCIKIEGSDLAEIISAYGSTTYDINSDPKYLKLYVVSVLDDGKIIYLDNLTWYDNDGKNYYMTTGNITDSSGKTPLDEYRNLVESNYSVFTSKVPGKLAILAKLETIENFSASVNIVKNGSSYNISFNTNWTYSNDNLESRSSINPSSIRCKLYKPKELIKDTDNSDGLTWNNWLYFKDSNKLSNRTNDGYDKDVLTEYVTILGANTDYDTQIYTFKLYPWMKYGYLKYLENTIAIDVNKLGTGATNLNEYRYYIEDEVLTLNYGFDAYPEEGVKINDVIFYFSELNTSNFSDLTILNNNSEYFNSNNYTTIDFLNGCSYNYSLVKKSDSFLGNFSNRIYWDSKSGLKKNTCYVVKIKMNYGGTPRYFYRILYTNKVFNEYYYSNTDFFELKLESLDYNYKIEDFNYETVEYSRTTEESITTEKSTIYKSVLQIPNSYVVSELNSIPLKDYIIKDDIENDIIFNIVASTKYNLFDVSINTISGSSANYTFDNTSKLQYILNGDSKLITSLTPNTDNITLGTKLVNGKIQITNNISFINKTPILIKYANIETIPILYQLVNLSTNNYYVQTSGWSESAQIGMDESRIDPRKSTYTSANSSDPFKDKDLTSFTDLAGINVIGNGVSLQLKNYDYISLVFNIYYVKGTDDKTRLVTYVNSEYGYRNNNKDNLQSEGQLYCCIVLFAFKTQSGFVITAIPNKVFGDTFTNTNKKNLIGDSSGLPKLCDLSANGFENAISSVLSDIYKVLDYGGSGVNCYVYSNIVYWNSYNINTNVKLHVSGNLSIFVNNVDLSKLSNINNFKYADEIDNVEINYSVKNLVDISNIINNIMTYSLSTTYVADYLGNKIELNQVLSKNSLYKYSNNTYTKLTNLYTGIKPSYDGLNLTIQASSSTIKFKCYVEDEGYEFGNIYLME